VPITHVAYDHVKLERDEARRYVGKEVLIIGANNSYKGWRGTLRSVSRDECEVAPGNAPIGIFKKNDVVVR
jgi:hypothetical protein